MIKDDPDVVLNVPNLSVKLIQLNVDNLNVGLSIGASVLNLVKLNAGAFVQADNVNLTIKGVQATALLVLRLDNVANILNRTLDLLENPEILTPLLESINNEASTVDSTIGDVGQVFNDTNGTLNNLGDVIQDIKDNSRDNVQNVIDNSGGAVEELPKNLRKSR